MHPSIPSAGELTVERYFALAEQGAFEPDERVELLRAPDGAAKCYRDHSVVRRGDRITLVAFPDASVAVSDLLPSPGDEHGA